MFYAYGMSITLRYADSREKAAAILNDAFMKVFDNLSIYNPDLPFKPWFRQIVVNTAINQYHKDRNRMKRLEIDFNENNLPTEEKITSSISYSEIIEMVQELSPAYRTVFNLYVIEGFTHEEIADLLDIAVGTSKSNLYKAKRNLRSLLEKNLT